MKKPKSIKKVSVLEEMIPFGPYPPLGYVPILEAELGNGDYYGLYWPLGNEENEPVVCDMSHDNMTLWPVFSSLDKFVKWLDVNEWERGEEEIEDYNFAPFYYAQGKAYLSSKNFDVAMLNIQKACESFPEMSIYWFSFSSLLRRINKMDEAIIACINAFISNWAFGLPSEGVLRMLKFGLKMDDFKDEPLMQILPNLSLKFGGKKENHQYHLLSNCAEEYFKVGKPIYGLKLIQNYALMMIRETTSFQERYKFSISDWRKMFSGFCLKYLGNNRKW